MKKLLISGGFGYLGGRFAQVAAAKGDFAIHLGTRQNIQSAYWLPQATIVKTNWESLFKLEEICNGIDAIVHFSGMNAQGCLADPSAALEVNAGATSRLLKAAINKGVKRFIYLSTAHVYASSLQGIITEEICPNNLHPYATSHRAGEDVVLAAHQRGEIEGVVIRLSNAYGAPTHKEVNCWMLLVNDLCKQVMTTQKMVLNSSGSQRRDFITLIDACMAIRHLLLIPAEKLGNGLFNVGGDWSPTILEMTKYLAMRFQIASGIYPEIICGNDKNNKNSELVDYRMEKLIETSFKINRKNVDGEIDQLIQFCLRNFRENQ